MPKAMRRAGDATSRGIFALEDMMTPAPPKNPPCITFEQVSNTWRAEDSSMAITTYDELKTSVADFLNRDDLTSVIPDFITMAEADLNRNVRHYYGGAQTQTLTASSAQFREIF